MGLRQILLKSLGHRIIVITYEFFLAMILPTVGLTKLTEYVAINNIFKFFGYVIYEMVWAGYLRTKFNLLGKIQEVVDP